MSEEIILVCAPTDSPMVPSGASFDHCCSKCTAPVVLAPTGQKFLKEHPEAVILCMNCWMSSRRGDEVKFRLSGSPEDVAREIGTAVPNTRRWRN